MDKPIVFLSHSSKDSKALNLLKQGLEQKTHGTIDFFLSSDGESIPFGKNWVATLEKALAHAEITFVFLSTHSVNSGWVHFESGFVYGKGVKVIPLAMPGIDLSKIPPPMSLLQGFNIHSHDSLNNIFAVLNKEFGTKHEDLFSKNDFECIFQNNRPLEQSYFGANSDLIAPILLRVESKNAFIPELQKRLEARNIGANVLQGAPGYAPQTRVLTSYGLTAYDESALVTFLRISPYLAGLMFDIVDEAVAMTENAGVTFFQIHFAPNVKIHCEPILTGKFFGTSIKILGSNKFLYKHTQFSLHPRQAIIMFDSVGKLRDTNAQELVSLLLEVGAIYEEIDPAFQFGEF